jgi:O-antigen ligase
MSAQSQERDFSLFLDRAIAAGLLLVIVFTALMHGAVEPWSVALFELGMLALLLLWGLKAIADRQLTVRVPLAVLPLAALITLGLAQSLTFTGSDGRRWSLSLEVEATRVTVMVLFFIFAAFLVAANFLARRERLRLLAKFLVIYGLALAVFGLVQNLAWDGRLYWLRAVTAEITSPFGPFVSHSHFAGYMELLLPVPVALIITRGLRFEARLFCGFAAAVMGVATVASLSRGGMISLLAELIFLAAWSVRRARQAAQPRAEWGVRSARLPRGFRAVSRAGAVALIALAITLGLFWIGWEPVLKRVTQGRVTGPETGTAALAAETPAETFFTSRGWIWRDTLALIRAYPVAGVGLGAFETAYPSHSQSDGSLRVNAAHNDYLQLLAEGGLIGGALALWFILVICRAITRGLRSRDPLRAGLSLGCGAGIFGMLAHSLFDFNLQLPSHALMFVLLSAVVARLGARTPQPASAEAGAPESPATAIAAAGS